MRKETPLSSGILVLLLTILSGSSIAGEVITQEELLRRTRSLLDGVAAANGASWQDYFAEDCLFFDEKGRSLDKASLVNEIGQLPEGYRVSFELEKSQSRIFDNIAIFSYDIDEDLTIFNQRMGARFHATDTWIRRDGKWQIIASQYFRYYGDAAPGEVDAKEFSEYVGTYELAQGHTAAVFLEGLDLYYRRGDRPKEQLVPEAPGIFFRAGVEGRILFRYGKNGKVDAMISRRNHEDLLWKKIQ